MPADTTEAALEACIERFLTGDVSTPPSNESVAREDTNEYDSNVHSRGCGTSTYRADKGVGYIECLRSPLIAQTVTAGIEV